MSFSERFALTTEQRERMHDEVLPTALREGAAIAHGFATDEQIERLTREKRRFRPNSVVNLVYGAMSHFVGDPLPPTFHGAMSATYADIIRDFGAAEVFQKISSTPKWLLPGVVSLGAEFADSIQSYGEEHSIAEFLDWRGDNFSLIKYQRLGRTCVFPAHADGTSTYIRLALALGPAIVAVNGHDEPTHAGDLEAYLSADFARSLSVTPAVHSVIPQGPRATVVFDSNMARTTN